MHFPFALKQDLAASSLKGQQEINLAIAAFVTPLHQMGRST